MSTEIKNEFPAHYTAEDVQAIFEINEWITANAYTQAALARLARISAGGISAVLKGTYATSPSQLLAKLQSAIANQDKAGAAQTVVVETSVYKLAQAACQTARTYRNFAVLSAYVGTGKTFALKSYQRANPNTHMIEATPMMTPASLIKRLALEVCGYDGRGSIADKFNLVVDALNDTDSLLIVDEAETLPPSVLEALRRVRDLAKVGVVLAGTEHLSGKIRPHQGQFDQIRSRTGFWPETVKKITDTDAAALVQAAFGNEEVPEDVVTRLYQYSKGSARMLMEGLVAGLKKYRQSHDLSEKLVDAVAVQILSLKPLDERNAK